MRAIANVSQTTGALQASEGKRVGVSEEVNVGVCVCVLYNTFTYKLFIRNILSNVIQDSIET